MAGNYLGIYTCYLVYSGKVCCVMMMVLKWEGKRRGGRQHKGSLFLGRDKSEVSFWIFNILQGTKRSYSSLVSGLFFFWKGRGAGACYVCLWIVACFLVNCCVACVSRFQQSLGNQSICGEIPLMPDVALGKKELKSLACITDSKGPNSMKWNIYYKWIKLSKCYLLHLLF